MQRRVVACAFFSTTTAAFQTSRRRYYDKVRKEREGSDDGPAAMFYEFPKNPSPNRVPENFHTASNEAVGAAEGLQRLFLLFFVVLIAGFHFTGFLDPFADDYRRPEGYGTRDGGSRQSEGFK